MIVLVIESEWNASDWTPIYTSIDWTPNAILSIWRRNLFWTVELVTVYPF